MKYFLVKNSVIDNPHDDVTNYHVSVDKLGKTFCGHKINKEKLKSHQRNEKKKLKVNMDSRDEALQGVDCGICRSELYKRTMKIVAHSNFDNESVSDLLIADNVHPYYGLKLIDFLQDKLSTTYSKYYFKLVDKDYKLYTFEP
jgi:hypothetical protein